MIGMLFLGGTYMNVKYLMTPLALLITGSIHAATTTNNLSATTTVSSTDSATVMSSSTIKNRMLAVSPAKTYENLRKGTFATYFTSGAPRDCFVANIGRGYCEIGYYAPNAADRSKPILKCLKRRTLGILGVPASVSTATVSSAQRVNLAASIANVQSTFPLFSALNPTSLAVSYFNADINANLCSFKNSTSITSSNLGSFDISTVGEGKDTQIYSDPSTASKFKCVSKNFSVSSLNAQCVWEKKAMILPDSICRYYVKKFKTSQSTKTLSAESTSTVATSSPTVSVPHVFPIWTAQLQAQFQPLIDMQTARPAILSASIAPNLTQLTVTPEISGFLSQLAAKSSDQQASFVGDFINTNLGNLASLTNFVASVQKEVAVNGASVSELTDLAPAYNHLVQNAFIQPYLGNLNLVPHVIPSNIEQVAEAHNAVIGNFIPASVIKLWQIELPASGPRPMIKPKVSCFKPIAAHITLSLANILVQDTGVVIPTVAPSTTFQQMYQIEVKASEANF
jgi:hypothetical protein